MALVCCCWNGRSWVSREARHERRWHVGRLKWHELDRWARAGSRLRGPQPAQPTARRGLRARISEQVASTSQRSCLWYLSLFTDHIRRYQAELDEMGRKRPTSQVPTGGNSAPGGGRPTTTKAPPIPLSQQTLSALLQFGIIVSAAQRSLHLSGDNSSLHWSYTLLLFLKQSPQNLDQLSTFNFPMYIVFFLCNFWGYLVLKSSMGSFFWQCWQKLFLGKGRRDDLSSLVASPAAIAQISGTLSVANTLIHTVYSQWPIHWHSIVPCQYTDTVLILNSVVLWPVFWYRIHPNTSSGRISYPPQVNIPIPVSWETFQRSIRKCLENPGI